MNLTMNICVLLVCFYLSMPFAQDTVKVEQNSIELCSNETEDSCEVFNSTELSTLSAIVEESSEIVKTTVRSKKPDSTTVKPVTKKPPLTPNVTTPDPHPHCTCDVTVIKTIAALHKKLGKHRYYSWSNPVASFPLFDVGSSYSKGSPIWISDNSTVTHLVFPAAVGHNTMCQSTVMPLYLEETATSCTRSLNSISDCLISSKIHFAVISSPQKFNFTHPQECTEDVCLPVHKYICSKLCTEGRIPAPKFNNLSKTCENVVESVEYKVYHNGSQGIIDVQAFYSFKNVTVHSDKYFREHYKITYVWSGSSSQPVLKRSGRPGYETSKPIISGRRNRKAVTFNSSASDWISVGISGSAGYCFHRRNLLFRENLLSQCLLVVNGTCNNMQEQIWKQLLGSSVNLTEVMISSYGDPRMELEAWLPLLRGEVPSLPTLTTAIEIIIIYSLVGSEASPQAKIIAAFLDLVPSGITCVSNYSTVMLQTSVKFIDKTTPTITKFAQPPVYEIKLPQDFFYPFLSVGIRNNNFSNLFLLLILILIIYNESNLIIYL